MTRSIRCTAILLLVATALTLSARTAAAQACRPVAGTNLEKFYPVMQGWIRGMPQSETDLDEAVSRTTVDFDRGTETISVELMDSCRNADVLLLLREALKTFTCSSPIVSWSRSPQSCRTSVRCRTPRGSCRWRG